MKKKFKVGQKVKIREWEDMKREFGLNENGNIKCTGSFVTSMKHLCGKVATIKEIYVSGFVILCFKKDYPNTDWKFSTDMIEPIENETIVIYRNGNEVVALNKLTGEVGVAKCSPEDKFEFYTGARLALGRLTEPKFKVLCVKDYYNAGELVWKKGEIYEYRNGKCTREDGFVSNYYKDFASLISCNPTYKNYLIELKDGDNVIEILKKYRSRIGADVKVIDTGYTYSTYSSWYGLGKYIQNYVREKLPVQNKVYKVLNIDKHEHGNEIALIQDPDTTQVFIIGLNGLEEI